MKFWEKCIIAVLTVVFVASLAWATGSFYWKDTFAGLDGIADSAGDRGVVIDTGGVTTFYYNAGAGWIPGYITGRMIVVSKSAAYTLGTDNPNELYRAIVYATATMTLTLPALTANSVGANFCVVAIGASTVTVDPNIADGIRLNGGTRATDGNYVISGGAAGETMCFVADSTAGWTAAGDSTWTAQ
jgi:hypothetical protein